MKEELMELIRNMVADDEMELTEDSEFVDDLGLSSMEFFDLISQVRGTVSCEVYGQRDSESGNNWRYA